ncbi:Uncharacterized conserved protein, DUF1697 family [Frankineae bacterium MT45]|nr:Uncharacterized conserved protein, DUF1697 family [Frankineae bacterium MT45]
MTEVIALLRGVNVGTANRIAMARLRELITDLGYQNPRTLLQSGNAIFEVRSNQVSTCAAKLEKALKDQAGVTSTVIIRSATELREAIAEDPLTEVAVDGAKHLIGFLAQPPSATAAKQINAIDLPPDRIAVIGRHVYLWMSDGVLKSRLSKSGWEKMLGTPVTARNVNTLAKLAAMLG